MAILTPTSRRIGLAVLATALAIGTARAVTDSAFLYSHPKNGYLMVDTFDMRPANSSTNFVSGFTTEGFAIGPGDSTTACFQAGLHFPDGATLSRVVVHFKSGASANGQPSVILWRKTPTGDALQAGNQTFADDTASPRSGNVPVTAALAVVDNARYSYGLEMCLHSTADRFYGARIAYTYKNAGD